MRNALHSKEVTQKKYCFYDLETSGLDKQNDQIYQFSAIITDEDFNIIDEPINIFCEPRDDVIPHPRAILTTGIDVNDLKEKGLNEYDFAREVNKILSQYSGLCVTGYNNIRFDNEFIRNLFYRNALNPYMHEYADENSKSDILGLVRLVFAMRPNIIKWKKNKQGVLSQTLVDMSEANNIQHENAHDALSDVYATLSIAKKIKDDAQELYNYYYKLTDKKYVVSLIENSDVFIHIDRSYGIENSCYSLVMPIAVMPNNPNAVVVWNLRKDPRDILNIPLEENRDELFSSRELNVLKVIYVNKCPTVVPLEMFVQHSSNRNNINIDECVRNSGFMADSPDFIEALTSCIDTERSIPDDVDMQLYSGGFLSYDDTEGLNSLHKSDKYDWKYEKNNFEDERVSLIIERILGRNNKEVLNKNELKEWAKYCLDKFERSNDALTYHEFSLECNELTLKETLSQEQLELISDLKTYVNDLIEKYTMIVNGIDKILKEAA